MLTFKVIPKRIWVTWFLRHFIAINRKPKLGISFIIGYWWFNLFSWFSVVPRWRSLMCWSDWKVKFVCVCVSIRYDRPEDASAKVQRGQNGEWERDAAAALQRIGHTGGNRESGCKYQAFSTLSLLSISSPAVCLSTAQWVWRQGYQEGRWPAGELHGDSRPRARWEPYRKRPARL